MIVLQDVAHGHEDALRVVPVMFDAVQYEQHQREEDGVFDYKNSIQMEETRTPSRTIQRNNHRACGGSSVTSTDAYLSERQDNQRRTLHGSQLLLDLVPRDARDGLNLVQQVLQYIFRDLSFDRHRFLRRWPCHLAVTTFSTGSVDLKTTPHQRTDKSRVTYFSGQLATRRHTLAYPIQPDADRHHERRMMESQMK